MLGSPRRSALLSALIHAIAIVLILILAASKHSILTELIPVRETPVYHQPLRIHVGGLAGGGGQRAPLPPSKGHPPRPAPRVFTPPIMTIQDSHPLLEMPPTVLSAVDTQLPTLNLPLGSLAGVSGPPSGGPGVIGGVGNGKHGGNGDNDGPGGDGSGGDGFTGLHGRNVTQPVLLWRTDPEYSDEARKVKLQGVVELGIEVNAAGQVTNVRVLRSLGLGLDERAIEAVRQWKFRAGTVDGKAASTRAIVEVNFRLL
jgi:periplasmic protein TonB